jgi:hypothetical protein
LVLVVLVALIQAHHKVVQQEQTLYFHLSLLQVVDMVQVQVLLLVVLVALVVEVRKAVRLVLELLDKDLMVGLA